LIRMRKLIDEEKVSRAGMEAYETRHLSGPEKGTPRKEKTRQKID